FLAPKPLKENDMKPGRRAKSAAPETGSLYVAGTPNPSEKVSVAPSASQKHSAPIVPETSVESQSGLAMTCDFSMSVQRHDEHYRSGFEQCLNELRGNDYTKRNIFVSVQTFNRIVNCLPFTSIRDFTPPLHAYVPGTDLALAIVTVLRHILDEVG